jgi:hypothetical protein
MFALPGDAVMRVVVFRQLAQTQHGAVVMPSKAGGHLI